MGIKWKKYRHSSLLKAICLMMLMIFATGSIHTAVNLKQLTQGNIKVIFEDHYLESRSFQMKYDATITQLIHLIDRYISEENILNGHTINDDDLEYRLASTYWEGEDHDHIILNYESKISF